ncbi:MAG: hypothetical protein RR087_06885 [Oscillospiraceae bacterium]
MKNIYRLAAWNLRGTVKLILPIWLFMGVTQFMYLMSDAAKKENAWKELMMPLPISAETIIFAAAYMAAIIISVYPVFVQTYGRAKGMYTLMSLPMPRRNILLANILSGLCIAFSTVAVQLMLFFVYYMPVMHTAETARLKAGYAFPVFVKDGLFLTFMRNDFMRILLPTTFVDAIIFVSVIVCTTVLLHCIPMHSGAIAKAVSLLLTLIGGMLGLAGLMFTITKTSGLMYVIILGLLIAISAAALIWAFSSLKKAKNL